MLVLSSNSKGLQFISLQHILIYKIFESKVFKNIKYLG